MIQRIVNFFFIKKSLTGKIVIGPEFPLLRVSIRCFKIIFCIPYIISTGNLYIFINSGIFNWKSTGNSRLIKLIIFIFLYFCRCRRINRIYRRSIVIFNIFNPWRSCYITFLNDYLSSRSIPFTPYLNNSRIT